MWQDRQLAAQRVEQWDMHARAAVALKGEAYNLGLQWQRQSDRFLLLLEAPFGQGVIRIDSAPGVLYRLQLPDGRIVLNQSPEALLEEVIGWSIPISGLEYWIRGIPRPDSSHSRRLDKAGRARTIEQDHWDIDYLDYFEPQDQPQLPRRIRLAREGITMKLVIERWQQAEIEDGASDLFPEFN